MKKFLAFILIVGLGVGIWYVATGGPTKQKSEQEDVLSKLGFTSEEVANIRDTFDEESVNKLMSLESKDLINEIINTKDYKNEKLDAYLDFYKNNKEVKISNIIKLVNNNIDKIDNLEYDDIILSLVDEKYYIYDNTVRYVNYYKDNSNISSKDIITNVNSNIDRPYYTDIENTDLSKGNLMIVNKYYQLSSNYEPEDLVQIEAPKYSEWGGYLTKDTYEAFKKMVDGAKEDGIRIYSFSPYRSYTTQYNTYWRYVNRDGREKADTYSARPGNSEHQTGLAVDINNCNDSFAYTDEYKWLINNSYKYGFILRYPKDKEYITGYQFEPWHYRYVGVEVATKIHDLDITFEEYYAYYIK